MNTVLKNLTHAEILGAISALLCLIGAFLPWGTISSIYGSISVSGIDRDGMITFIFSLIALGIVYLGTRRSKKGIINIGIIIIGFLIALIAIVDGLGITEISEDSEYIYMQVGIGLYLTGICGIGLIIAGLWNFGKKESEVKHHNNRYCPNCGRNIPFDANICPYCSKKFEVAEEEYEKMKKQLED